MKRLNPKTGRPFKKGERRDDGFFFWSYSTTRIKADGYCREGWMSPDRWEKAQLANKSYQKQRREEITKLLNSIKIERGCADCGYNEHPAALDFDHLPGSEKLISIGQQKNRARSEVLTEVEKCEVVCANCHRIRTAKRGRKGWATYEVRQRLYAVT